MSDLTAHLVQTLSFLSKQTFQVLYFTTIEKKWRIVSILLLHKLHIPFQYPMRKSLCSINITLCINFHWNSLQLLKQYESKALFQIDFQFIALSCNLTCHLVFVFRGSRNLWARCCLIMTLDFNTSGSISFPFCSYG